MNFIICKVNTHVRIPRESLKEVETVASKQRDKKLADVQRGRGGTFAGL